MAVFSKKERLGLYLLEDVISFTVKTIKIKKITKKVRAFIIDISEGFLLKDELFEGVNK